jgi:hypothetical protein
MFLISLNQASPTYAPPLFASSKLTSHSSHSPAGSYLAQTSPDALPYAPPPPPPAHATMTGAALASHAAPAAPAMPPSMASGTGYAPAGYAAPADYAATAYATSNYPAHPDAYQHSQPTTTRPPVPTSSFPPPQQSQHQPPHQLPPTAYAAPPNAGAGRPTPPSSALAAPDPQLALLPEGVVPCAPQFLCPTVGTFPSSTPVRLKTNLLFGLIVQPLAPPPSNDPLPEVNFGELGVLRCDACRTYINPYVFWPPQDRGAKWVCNMCRTPNAVPVCWS